MCETCGRIEWGEKISEEKRAWLKDVGAFEHPDSVKFIYPLRNGMQSYSEQQLAETPLEELKRVHEYLMSIEALP